MHDVLAQLAVVGHEDQALGIVVEAAHVEHALVLVPDDVGQRVAAFRVVHGAEHLLGLVERQRDMVRVEVDARAVHTDVLLLRIDAGAEFGHQLPVDLDTPIGDHLLALAA